MYLTIDADGLGPSHLSGIMGPTLDGHYTEQVTAIIQALAKRNRLVGMGIVRCIEKVSRLATIRD